MPNYLKTVQVRLAPTQQQGETGLWSNQNQDFIINGTYAGLNYNIPDEHLWPETTYSISVLSATDAYDNDVTANVSITLSKRMKNDYPAFSRAYVFTNKDTEHNIWYFIRPKNQAAYSDHGAQTLNVQISDDVDSARGTLNSTFLDANGYVIKGLGDWNDVNFYSADDVKNGESSWSHADHNDSLYPTYYGMQTVSDTATHNIYGNILIPGGPTLIPIDIFNKKLGIYTATGTFIWNGGTLTTASYTFDGGTKSVQGDQNPIPENVVSQEGLEITGSEQGSIRHFIEDEEVFGIYQADKEDIQNADNDSAFIGIRTKDWSVPQDAYGFISVTAQSKTKATGDGSESYLNIPFYTFAPPTLELEQQVTADYSTYTPVSNMTVTDSMRRTGITFTNSNTPIYGAIRLNMSTHKCRPFLPLVSKEYGVGNPVYESGITEFTAYNEFLDYKNGNGTTVFNEPGKQTPFILEVSCDSVGTINEFNSDNQIDDPETDFWRVIGYTPSYMEDDSTKPNFLEDYALSEDTKYSIYRATAVAETGAAGKQLSEDVKESSNRCVITWPTNEFQIDDGFNGIEGLIPGKYYKFRATAANFCGTSPIVFNVRTKEASTRTYGSSIYVNGSVVGAIAPTENASASTSVSNLPTGTQLTIYGGENRVANEHYTVITANGEPNGWQSSSTDTKIEVSTDGSTYTQLTYDDRTLNYVDAQYTLSQAGTYYFRITSNSCKLANSSAQPGNTKVHTYTVTAADGRTLTVTTGNNTQPSAQSAIINGSYTLGGQGHSVTKVGFKYWTGTEPADATASTVDNANAHVAADSLANLFSKTLSSLQANTTYYYRAYAVTSDSTIGSLGGLVYGAVQSFTTNEDLSNIQLNVTGETRTTAQIILS